MPVQAHCLIYRRVSDEQTVARGILPSSLRYVHDDLQGRCAGDTGCQHYSRRMRQNVH